MDSTSIPKKPLFRPEEVADIFEVSPRTIYRWIESGTLDGSHPAGTARVKRYSIIKLLEESE